MSYKVTSVEQKLVSPEWIKIGAVVITHENRNTYSRLPIAVACSLPMTPAIGAKSAVLSLGNLRSIR
jgi:hypothetical protein